MELHELRCCYYKITYNKCIYDKVVLKYVKLQPEVVNCGCADVVSRACGEGLCGEQRPERFYTRGRPRRSALCDGRAAPHTNI